MNDSKSFDGMIQSLDSLTSLQLRFHVFSSFHHWNSLGISSHFVRNKYVIIASVVHLLSTSLNIGNNFSAAIDLANSISSKVALLHCLIASSYSFERISA